MARRKNQHANSTYGANYGTRTGGGLIAFYAGVKGTPILFRRSSGLKWDAATFMQPRAQFDRFSGQDFRRH